MGALIGVIVQLLLIAVGLMITVAVWTVRLTIMLFAMLIAAASARRA